MMGGVGGGPSPTTASGAPAGPHPLTSHLSLLKFPLTLTLKLRALLTPPMQRRRQSSQHAVNLRSLARQLGVSAMTVSNAFNRPEELSSSLRQRILSAAAQLGYHGPHPSGRILRTGARMLLLDEPTEGLAPVIVQQIGKAIRELKARGFTILLVEQNLRFAGQVADRHYVMEHGQVIDMIPNHRLEANMDKLHEYLGV